MASLEKGFFRIHKMYDWVDQKSIVFGIYDNENPVYEAEFKWDLHSNEHIKLIMTYDSFPFLKEYPEIFTKLADGFGYNFTENELIEILEELEYKDLTDYPPKEMTRRDRKSKLDRIKDDE